MYVSPTPEQRAERDIARTCSNRILASVQTEAMRYRDLDRRDSETSLSGMDLLTLASSSASLADALERVAAEWDTPSPALATAYRWFAAQHRGLASLAEVCAELDDPFRR